MSAQADVLQELDKTANACWSFRDGEENLEPGLWSEVNWLLVSQEPTPDPRLPLESLSVFRSLESLDLGQGISQSQIVRIPVLTSVRRANCSGLSLTGVVEQLSERLPNVRELNLSHCDLTDDDIASLGTLRDLHSVNLSGNPRLTGTHLGQVFGNSKLRELVLDGTAVGDDLISTVAGLDTVRLEKLSLMNTHVSRKSIPNFAKLTHLRALVIWNSNMTMEDELHLKASLKHCEVSLGP